MCVRACVRVYVCGGMHHYHHLAPPHSGTTIGSGLTTEYNTYMGAAKACRVFSEQLQ